MKNNLALLLALATATPILAEVPEVMVMAHAETTPTDGDADDPAIWVHPTDPSRSLVLGTDKTAGLYVFDLEGAQVAFFDDGNLNNVDIRPFTLAGEQVWLASAAERSEETLTFRVIREDGTIARAAPFAFPGAPDDLIASVKDIYGSAMMSDPATGRVWAVVNYKSGHVIQWEVTDNGGEIALTFARQLQVPSQPEGMVSDDAAGYLYIGEEDSAIWRFPAFPENGDTGTAIATIPSDCLPRDDIEGMAVYNDGINHLLVVSAQGIHRAAIFDLASEAPTCLGLVGIEAGTVDGVTETDGLDVTALPLGPAYAAGMMVMMDDQNEMFTTNFKYIPFADVKAALELN